MDFGIVLIRVIVLITFMWKVNDNIIQANPDRHIISSGFVRINVKLLVYSDSHARCVRTIKSDDVRKRAPYSALIEGCATSTIKSGDLVWSEKKKLSPIVSKVNKLLFLEVALP